MKRMIALLLVTALPSVASAQQNPAAAPLGAAPAGDENNEKGDRSRLVKVKDWTIKKEVDTLTLSMKQFNGLIRSLSKANDDLGDEFKKYLANPNDELLGSRVEKKLAKYAANVSKDFDTIIASQDVFISNFRNLRHKLGQLKGQLSRKAKNFEGQLGDYRTEAVRLDKELRKLAQKIKDPDLDPEERKRLRREFLTLLRRYKMQKRYLKGYSARYRGYLRLTENMGNLSNLFGSLHTKFEDLISNLENEKKYLRASIELQADTMRIKKLIREGIVGGEKAITNVSEKLAQLYLKVDTFNKVHDRISDQMTNYLDTQGPLLGVTEKIEKIGGLDGDYGSLSGDLDKIIDDFATKDTDPGADLPATPVKGGANSGK